MAQMQPTGFFFFFADTTRNMCFANIPVRNQLTVMSLSMFFCEILPVPSMSSNRNQTSD